MGFHSLKTKFQKKPLQQISQSPTERKIPTHFHLLSLNSLRK